MACDIHALYLIFFQVNAESLGIYLKIKFLFTIPSIVSSMLKIDPLEAPW